MEDRSLVDVARPVVLLYDRIEERERWLELRRQGIGGSDAAAAIGLSRWRDPLTVWLDKRGYTVPDQGTEAAGWGLRLEEVIAEELARRLEEPVRLTSALVRHPTIPWMLASPDALVMGAAAPPAALVEIKLVGPRMIHAWDEGLPAEVEIQARHNMAVCDLDRGIVAALLGGVELRTFELERDRAAEARLIELEAAFWELVDAGVPPAVTGSDDEHEAVMASLVDPDGIEVPAREIRSLLSAREAAKDAQKVAATAVNVAEEQIALLLQGHRAGLVDGDVVVERRESIVRQHVRAESKRIYWWTPKGGQR